MATMQPPPRTCTPPEEKKYFFGKRSRAEAEQILIENRAGDGLFLLRQRLLEYKHYALSMCYEHRFYHYDIKQHSNGYFGIQNGITYPGPVELMEHLRTDNGGLVTELRAACNRQDEEEPLGLFRMNMTVSDQMMLDVAEKMGLELNSHNIKTILSHFHEHMEWFHGGIGREDAEERLHMEGLENGLFLVRQKREDMFVLTMAYENDVRHYKIEKSTAGFLLENSTSVCEALILLIDFYYHSQEGLRCQLTRGCSKYSPAKDEDYDVIYGNPLPLERNRLSVGTQLGKGNFGFVKKGVYTLGNVPVPVAVKMLKNNQVVNTYEQILREAEVMSHLNHKYIIRLLGYIGETDAIMLVLELAPLGPLINYLRRNRHVSINNIMEVLVQVAEAMAYLEEKRFVHRDLAGRNVLLVNQNYAKISDFGMSRMIGADKDYYEAKCGGMMPLKWYAPECIYYQKFKSSSDVWSYGITCWECLSYGLKPYGTVKIGELTTMLENGERLEKPLNCPAPVYDIMRQCWAYSAEDRPDFATLVTLMKNCYLLTS